MPILGLLAVTVTVPVPSVKAFKKSLA